MSNFKLEFNYPTVRRREHGERQETKRENGLILEVNTRIQV
jgi:hypothetical protein